MLYDSYSTAIPLQYSTVLCFTDEVSYSMDSRSNKALSVWSRGTIITLLTLQYKHLISQPILFLFKL